jgi:transcription termination factor Rho
MAALLMIVARDRVPLYERLREEFHAEEAVDVVLDRRVAERRQTARPVAADQRQGTRRHTELDGHLKRIGWATVRVR